MMYVLFPKKRRPFNIWLVSIHGKMLVRKKTWLYDKAIVMPQATQKGIFINPLFTKWPPHIDSRVLDR